MSNEAKSSPSPQSKPGNFVVENGPPLIGPHPQVNLQLQFNQLTANPGAHLAETLKALKEVDPAYAERFLCVFEAQSNLSMEIGRASVKTQEAAIEDMRRTHDFNERNQKIVSDKQAYDHKEHIEGIGAWKWVVWGAIAGGVILGVTGQTAFGLSAFFSGLGVLGLPSAINALKARKNAEATKNPQDPAGTEST